MKKQGSDSRHAASTATVGTGALVSAPVEWRRACAKGVLVYVVVLLGVTLPTPLYVRFQERWELSNGDITALYALYPAGVLLVLLVAAHWPSTLGGRRTLGIAIAFSSASSGVLLLATAPWMIAVGRLATGLSSGFAVGAANQLLTALAPAWRVRSASVLSSTFNQVGLGLGALLAGVLVQYAPWPMRLTFGFHLIALAVAAVVLWSVPEPTRRSHQRVGLRLQKLRLPTHHRREFWAAALAAFAAFALCGLLASLAPSIARHELHADNALYASGAVGVVFAVSGASQAWWVRLRDSTGLVLGSVMLLVSESMLTVGLLVRSTPLLVIGVLLSGAAVGALFMCSLALVNHMVDNSERAGATGAYFAITFSGLIVPVVSTGVLTDHFSQMQAVLSFDGVVVAATVGAMCLLARARFRASNTSVAVAHRGAP